MVGPTIKTSLWWTVRNVGGSNSRLEATTLIETVDASIFATALKEDVVTISRPSLGESSLNDCVTMSQPTKLRMGYHIF